MDRVGDLSWRGTLGELEQCGCREADAAVSVYLGAVPDCGGNLISGVSVATVGRAHALNANQLFHWSKLYQAGLLGNDVGPPRMLPVTLCSGEAQLPGTLSEVRASDSSPMP